MDHRLTMQSRLALNSLLPSLLGTKITDHSLPSLSILDLIFIWLYDKSFLSLRQTLPNRIPPGGCLRFNNKAFFLYPRGREKKNGKNNSVLIARTVSSDETNRVMHVRVEKKSKCGVEAQPVTSW